MIPPDQISAEAKNWYDTNEGPLAFENVVFRCLSRGVIIKTGDFFLMAERVRSASGTLFWDDEKPNCWFVHWGGERTGDWLNKFWEAWGNETPLKYLAWSKRGKIKVYDVETWRKGTYGWRRRRSS